MKKKLLIFLMFFSISLVWLMYSTGFFRTIDKKFDGNILKKISIDGVEDITINQKEGFAIISSTKRKNLPPVEQENGDLYLIDLKNMESNLDEKDKIKYKDDIKNNRDHLSSLKDKNSSEWREYATKCMIEIIDNKGKA